MTTPAAMPTGTSHYIQSFVHANCILKHFWNVHSFMFAHYLSHQSLLMCFMSHSEYYWFIVLWRWRKAMLWSGCSHVYIWVSRIIIISLHVSSAYLQQMFGNWICIIHQTICYSFPLYLFCFRWIEHAQNECSESFITCQWTELMRDMKVFCQVLYFGELKLSTIYFCSLNIYWMYLKSSNGSSVPG